VPIPTPIKGLDAVLLNNLLREEVASFSVDSWSSFIPTKKAPSPPRINRIHLIRLPVSMFPFDEILNHYKCKKGTFSIKSLRDFQKVSENIDNILMLIGPK
jgi:hypothetical protein